MELNTLTVFTQDGERHFELEEGGYCLEDGKITISVSCKPTGDTDHSALLCLESYPISNSPKPGDRYTQAGGMDRVDEPRPGAWAYFGFHVDRVQQTWEVLAVDGEAIEVSVIAVTEDIDYYDERAKDTETKGRFRLLPVSTADLWLPN